MRVTHVDCAARLQFARGNTMVFVGVDNLFNTASCANTVLFGREALKFRKKENDHVQ